MVDITKCMGGACILKKTCYRYKAKDGTWQSYFMVPPFINDKCDYYYKINNPVDTPVTS